MISLKRLVEHESGRKKLTPAETRQAVEDLVACRLALMRMPYLGGRIHDGESVSAHLEALAETLRDAASEYIALRDKHVAFMNDVAAMRRVLGLKEE